MSDSPTSPAPSVPSEPSPAAQATITAQGKRVGITTRVWAVCRDFSNEARRNLAAALLAGFALILALTVRDTISTAIDLGLARGGIEGALAKTACIVVISIIGIYLVTRLLAVKDQARVTVEDTIAEGSA